MMNEKKQRRTVLIGVLLLTGLFALGYIGINRIAFAGSGTTAVLGVQDNNLDEEEEVIDDEYNGRGRNFCLDPLQDQCLTREEAGVIAAEVLYEGLGIEVDTSKLYYALTEQCLKISDSVWVVTTYEYDVNGQIHDVFIDAFTGEMIRLSSTYASKGFYTTVEHRGTRFRFVEWGNPVDGPDNSRYISPHMISQTEAATIVDDFLFESYGVSMEDIRMEMSLCLDRTCSLAEEGAWQVWIRPSEGEEFRDFESLYGNRLVLVTVNATTGMIAFG